MKTTHPNIESMQVILSRKDSMFEAPYSENEIAMCSLNYNEWVQNMKEAITSPMDKQVDWRIGFGMDWLPETEQIASKFGGFMWAPTAKYGTKMLMAMTIQKDTVQEILDMDFSDCFLYVVGGQLFYINTHPNPLDTSIDPDKYHGIMKEYMVPKYRYVVRYAKVV